MANTRRAFLIGAAHVIGGVALAACAPVPIAPGPATTNTAPATTVGEIKRGGQLIFADTADPKSMDPALITNRIGARVLQMLYDPLIDLDTESNLVPALAESWDISSDAKAVNLARAGFQVH